METAERKAVVGSPDLETLTTSHIERAFPDRSAGIEAVSAQGAWLQQRPRNPQAGRGAALRNLQLRPRASYALGTTPAVAAGVEFERWSLERVVEMTAEYFRRKGMLSSRPRFPRSNTRFLLLLYGVHNGHCIDPVIRHHDNWIVNLRWGH